MKSLHPSSTITSYASASPRVNVPIVILSATRAATLSPHFPRHKPTQIYTQTGIQCFSSSLSAPSHQEPRDRIRSPSEVNNTRSSYIVPKIHTRSMPSATRLHRLPLFLLLAATFFLSVLARPRARAKPVPLAMLPQANPIPQTNPIAEALTSEGYVKVSNDRTVSPSSGIRQQQSIGSGNKNSSSSSEVGGTRMVGNEDLRIASNSDGDNKSSTGTSSAFKSASTSTLASSQTTIRNSPSITPSSPPQTQFAAPPTPSSSTSPASSAATGVVNPLSQGGQSAENIAEALIMSAVPPARD